MRFHPPEEKIELYKTGFAAVNQEMASDILQRAEIGKKLSNIVQNVEDSLVIAVNSGWGTGKTWFLQRWVGAHGLENGGEALTVYISAFNHDYLEDPLPALIMAIEERLEGAESKTNQLLAEVKKYGGILGRFFVRAGLAAITSGASLVAKSGAEAVSKAITDTANQQGNEALNAYWQQEKDKQAAMREFVQAISAFAAKQKLVIVIDELDRARPDYALSVLETIKHFFSVDGIHFVLGVNMEKLESMVKCRYGSDIGADGYLQRFISFSLTLPDAIQKNGQAHKTVLAYMEWAAKEMGIEPQLASLLQNHLSCVTKNNSLSLREAERILSMFTLIATATGIKNFLQLPVATLEICLALISSNIIKHDYYQKFLNATISESEVLYYYGVEKQTYRDISTRYTGFLQQHHVEAAPINAFQFIKYFYNFPNYCEKMRSYGQSTGASAIGLDSAFMWLKAVTKASEPYGLQNLTERLKLNGNSAAWPISQQVQQQYLDIFNLDFAVDENSNEE